jgi:hypothetical protein
MAKFKRRDCGKSLFWSILPARPLIPINIVLMANEVAFHFFSFSNATAWQRGVAHLTHPLKTAKLFSVPFSLYHKEFTMAKKPVSAKKTENAPPVNKPQAVRDYLKANPRTANKDVAEALTKQGIKMAPEYVAVVKGKMKGNKGKRKRRQKAAEVASVKTGIGIAELKAAFALLKHCGGISQAREALAAAVEIQKVM